MPIKTALFLIFLTLVGCPASRGVIFLGPADSVHNTTSPGDNSGWQYEGQFGAYLGTPVAPLYFLTAAHIGGADAFIFHGETYTPVAYYTDPSSDLRLWKVDHAFADYAPVFTASAGTEPGRELRVHGRGTERGTERFNGSDLRGWDWGADTQVQRWGSNVVTDLLTFGDAPILHVAFDNPGIPDECHLTGGDSGGGLFIQENGLWKLAGINYGVDDLYTTPNDAGRIISAVFDARGFYTKEDNGSFTLIADPTNPVPTSFYSTRVAGRLTWIQNTTRVDPTVLPPESFAAWSTLYFTPTERGYAATSGPAADPDGDGVPNLLEYAFNLDPTVAEPALLTPETGVRGLPLIRLETVDSEPRLTVEFVRRTAAGGASLTYTAQFASDLAAANWQPGGTTVVTPINARWERVKVTDSVAAGATGATTRFARVAVTQN